ncbi:Sugar/inositol transporter [Fusarium oxysporum f. sp. vasinfectum]|nr:Sugar/inositol transporter [Fusarium oxysporum f. sp. vasinfectum]
MAGIRLRDVSGYLILLIAITTLGSLQFGFHLAELNAPQDVITCRKKSISALDKIKGLVYKPKDDDAVSGFMPHCIPMDEASFATISSIFMLGGLLGALASGPFSSKRGRLPAMRITGLLYLFGAAVETVAGSVFVMVLGRLFAGIGAGASTVVVPLYISEIAPPKERGLFGFMTQISINFGILVVQTMGFFLSYGTAWRWILATGVFIATAQTLGLFVVPESPSWLAAQGNAPKAKRTLQRIRGNGYDIHEETETWDSDDRDASEEDGLLQADSASESPSKTRTEHLGFFEVLRDPDTRPAIVAVVGIMFAQQLCVSSSLLTILVSVVNLFTTIACAPLPDRLGRKTCLLASIIGQGTSALILAISIIFGIKILSAIAVVAFVGFFAVGLGPVPFLISSELVGQEAVGATQSWCLAANYAATFLVAQFFPIVNSALNDLLGGHGWVYFIFAGLAAGSAIFVFWNVPETKGKKDVDEVWGRTRRVD